MNTVGDLRKALETIPDNHPIEFVIDYKKITITSVSYGGVISTIDKEPIVVPAIIDFSY